MKKTCGVLAVSLITVISSNAYAKERLCEKLLTPIIDFVYVAHNDLGEEYKRAENYMAKDSKDCEVVGKLVLAGVQAGEATCARQAKAFDNHEEERKLRAAERKGYFRSQGEAEIQRQLEKGNSFGK